MIITIARQCGCDALQVGMLLAQHYGVPFYTRKSLFEMANRQGVVDEMENFFDERPVDELLFAMASFGESRNELTEKPLRCLTNLIGDGDCIIIGRCGNYIFKERKDLVSVFLKGDLRLRIQHIEETQHLSYESAKDFVEHTDDCREAYHKYYTSLTWGNANDYDICLDSSVLGAEKSAQLIENYIDLAERQE